MPKPSKPPGKPVKPPIEPPPVIPPVEPPVSGPLPELPRVQVDVTYVQQTGKIIQAHDSFQFQDALNASLPGDTIVLDASAAYLGAFTLPKKSETAPVYVMTSALAAIPAQNVRVTPADAPAMPKLISPTSFDPVLKTEAGAHHFRFIGIDFGSDNRVANNGLIRLGTGSETNVNEFPHHIILDRCLVRGDSSFGGVRGVLFAGDHLAVIDSHLSDWKLTDRDAQAIAGWTGRGPWRITNCHLEASGEAFLSGGSDPLISDLVPSDIELRSNLFTKPLNWNPFHSSYDGSSWQCKNALELKNARRVLMQGNRFENNWWGAQSGAIILFTPKNQYGVAPWTTVEDVTCVGNRIAGTLRGFSISGQDGVQPSAGGRRILIKNNYISDLGGAVWGENQYPAFEYSTVFHLTGGMDDLNIDHNTIIHGAFDAQGALIYFDGAPYLRFFYTNNIAEHNAYGIKGGGTGVGNATLAVYAPGAVLRRNLIVGGIASLYPADNFFPASMQDVGFVNYPADVRLGASSIYNKAAIDGTNPGAADSLLTQ